MHLTREGDASVEPASPSGPPSSGVPVSHRACTPRSGRAGMSRGMGSDQRLRRHAHAQVELEVLRLDRPAANEVQPRAAQAAFEDRPDVGMGEHPSVVVRRGSSLRRSWPTRRRPRVWPSVVGAAGSRRARRRPRAWPWSWEPQVIPPPCASGASAGGPACPRRSRSHLRPAPVPTPRRCARSGLDPAGGMVRRCSCLPDSTDEVLHQ